MLIGESLLIGAHGQGECNGLLTLGNVAALIYVEEGAALQVLAAGSHDAVGQLTHGDGSITDNSDVTGGGGELGQRLVYRQAALDRVESLEAQLSSAQ